MLVSGDLSLILSKVGYRILGCLRRFDCMTCSNKNPDLIVYNWDYIAGAEFGGDSGNGSQLILSLYNYVDIPVLETGGQLETWG